MSYDDEQPGVEQDARAIDYRETALRLLDNDAEPAVAIVYALLAVEARLEELSVYLAQLR